MRTGLPGRILRKVNGKQDAPAAHAAEPARNNCAAPATVVML